MKKYEINKNTLAIIAITNGISKVYEKDKTLYVYSPTIKIIDDSCKFFGSSYSGRFEGTKNLLNVSYKSPIIIEEQNKIIFFPTRSPRISSCSWISLNNIDCYYREDKSTVIKFIGGRKIKIKLSYGVVDNQVLRATRLESTFNKRVNI